MNRISLLLLCRFGALPFRCTAGNRWRPISDGDALDAQCNKTQAEDNLLRRAGVAKPFSNQERSSDENRQSREPEDCYVDPSQELLANGDSDVGSQRCGDGRHRGLLLLLGGAHSGGSAAIAGVCSKLREAKQRTACCRKTEKEFYQRRKDGKPRKEKGASRTSDE